MILPLHLIALCLSFTGEHVVPPCRSWVEAIEYLMNDPELYVDWLIHHHGGVDNALINCVGDARLVKALLARGADVHACNDNALVAAVERGCVESVKLLVEAGADVVAQEDYPMILAADNGRVDIIRVLLNAGASVNPGHGHILGSAAQSGHVDAVRVLLDAGARVDTNTYTLDCALTNAAWDGHLDVVQVLLEAGAHANDYSALMGAALGGYDDVFCALVASGADIRCLGEHEYMDIAGEGSTRVLEVLIQMDDRIDMYIDAMIVEAVKHNQIDTTRMLCRYKLM